MSPSSNMHNLQHQQQQPQPQHPQPPRHQPPQQNQVCAFYSTSPATTLSGGSRKKSSSYRKSMSTNSIYNYNSNSDNSNSNNNSNNNNNNNNNRSSTSTSSMTRNVFNSIVASVSKLRPSRSFRQLIQRATYIHFLLLPALLLLVIEMFPPVPLQQQPQQQPQHILSTTPSTNLSQHAASITSSKLLNSHPSILKTIPSLTPPATSLLPSEGFPFPTSVSTGNSIVVCCMNRHATLRKTLATWVQVVNVSEILIVDWSSDPPLRPIVTEMYPTDTRIRVLRVDNETQWVLTRAYNLGISSSSYSATIRTDCDYALTKNFIAAHPLTNASFYAGNYAFARDENEAHLNGAVYIRRADFLRVGGYDERIQTYGWDDEELYARLQSGSALASNSVGEQGAGGMKKLNLSFNHVSHVPHDDSARAQRDVKFVQVEIDLNSLLLKHLGHWNATLHDSVAGTNQWSVQATEERYARLSATHKPAALKDLVSEQAYEDAWQLALGQRLANDYHMPWDIMETMSVITRRKLLENLNARMKHRPAHQPARMLFVHCMHGLGNRLRALASAMAYADATNRELVVVWEKDAHIAARFDDLFDTEHIVALNYFKPKWPFTGYEKWDHSWLQFDFYNYMEMEGNGAIKGKQIVDDESKHLYFKSAYIMEVTNASLTNWDRDNAMLRSLTPVPQVVDMVNEQLDKGLEKMVGVHIRDRTLDRDIKNVDFGSEYGQSASHEMEYWRKKSSYQNFVVEMKRMMRDDTQLKFYVATDTAGLFDTLGKEFPGRIVFTHRDCDGRDGRCVRFALVDLLCLAKTRELIGSNWSSFTEAASRFSGKAPRLSGVDFANDTATSAKQ